MHRRILLALTAVAVVCAGICLGCLSLYFGALYLIWPRFESYFSVPMLAFLNLLPVVLVLVFLWILTDRPWLAFLLTAALVVSLTYANYYKVVFRDDPLVAEDLASMFEAFQMVGGGGYTISLGPKFRLGIWLCLGGTAVLWLFARGHVARLRVRAAISLAPVAAMLGAYFLWYTDDTLYESLENYSLFNRWEPSEKNAAHGFLYSFVHSIPDCFPEKPEGYSKSAARQIMEEYPDAAIPADEQVNFVCIMLESFSDFSVFDSINFTADPYEAFHTLAAESYTGTMISDSMGGGTINAERSFLAGTLYPHPSYRTSSWSNVQWLRDQGYATEGCHPGYAWYYNRENINENLGFDAYHFKEDYFDNLTDAEYAYDDVLLPAIRAQYEAATESGGAYFSFSVSYQNHGAYDATALTWGTEYVSHDGLTDEQYYIVNNYLGGIADTGERLLTFVDAFRDDTEPVVIVLFGDHKPTLGDGNSAYEALGISLDRTTLEGFEAYYATPCLIWANDAARELTGGSFIGTGPTIGPYFLMNEVFDQCGYTGPAFLQLSRALQDEVQVLHSTGKYLAGGELLSVLPETAAEAERRFAIAQYYLRKSY